MEKDTNYSDRDYLGVYDKDSQKIIFTVEKIAEFYHYNLPNSFNAVRKKEINNFAVMAKNVKESYCVFFDINNDTIENIKSLVKKRTIIISNRDLSYINDILLIKIDNPYQAMLSLTQYYKNVFKIPTIGITGTVGKTTLTQMLHQVLSLKYKVFVSGGNLNAPLAIMLQILNRMDASYDVHVQETGAGFEKCVETSVRFLDADYFIITNLNGNHHADKYSKKDGMIYDKLSYDRLCKPEAIGIINIDNEKLNDIQFNHHIVSFAIDNNLANCKATNITEYNDGLTYTIDYNGKNITGNAKILGKHNIYSIMAVYIVCTFLGLEKDDILNGIMMYRTSGIRQNLRKIAGRYFYIDCFNVCESSINTCLETLQNYKIDEHNNKIAILGGENAIGNNVEQRNYHIGMSLKGNSADKYIFLGTDKILSTKNLNLYGASKSMYLGALNNKNINKCDKYYTTKLLDIANVLKNTKPGDFILMKGIFRLGIFAAIDMAFYSSYCSLDNQTFVPFEILKEGNFTGRKYEFINKVYITGIRNLPKKFVIPDSIDGVEVFGLKNNLFYNNQYIEYIDCGNKLKNIGKSTFAGCTMLKDIKLNDVRFLEEKCFQGCTELKSIVLNNVIHISNDVFSGCSNLLHVYISDTCMSIEGNSFKCCNSNLTIVCKKDSYVHYWAIRNNCNYMAI